MPKRLYLSKTDAKIFGVCGGVAEYFDVDSTWVRLGYIVFTIITGALPGIVVYIAAALIMPKR